MIEPVGSSTAERTVTLVVEQLRRGVPGGIGTYVRQLVRALVTRADFEPGALTLYASRSHAHDDPIRRLGASLRTTPIPGPLLTRLWELGTGPRVADAGIVHAPSLALPPTHLPLVVTIHDLAFQLVPETFTKHGRDWHERALKRAARVCDAFVVPSEPVATQLVGAGLGISPDQVHVIGEGSDHLGAPDQGATTRLLERLGVKGKFILSVGTIEPRKNLARLTQAFDRVRDQLIEPCTLVICGPTGWMSNVAPTEGVVLAGQVSDSVLAGLYARAQLLAYVPLAEGFGLPVVEAMRYGAVVLASAVPSAQHGALVVDAFDVDAIAGGLVRCLQDKALREQLRTDGLAYSEGLTWQRTAEAHLALWNEVATR